jgi:creatine kinase/arginine kinase
MFSLFGPTSSSLVKKHLSEDLYNTLKIRSTDSGFTLDKAIRSGRANVDSSIGIYAGDARSYEVFSEIFAPIIEEYHGVKADLLHRSDLTPVSLPLLDPEKKYIVSTRVRVARNIVDFAFTNHISLQERKRLEQCVVIALAGLPHPYKGEYHSFSTSQDITELFEKGDRFQDAAGMNTDFPLCRGIFYSGDRRLRTWLNEEDHLRIISQENSTDLAGVFNHLCRALVLLEKKLTFAWDDRYGFLTSCPTNVGTSMRAGVHIRLKKLGNNREILDQLVARHQLQLRGTKGENTKVTNSVFDISNKRRLGISEVEIIRGLHQGLAAIIAAEENRV